MTAKKPFHLYLMSDDLSRMERYMQALSGHGLEPVLIPDVKERVEEGHIRDQDILLLDLASLEGPWKEIRKLAEGRKAAYGLILLGRLEEFLRLPRRVWSEVDGVILEGGSEEIFVSEIKSVLSEKRPNRVFRELSIIRSLYRQGKDRFFRDDFDDVSSFTLQILKVAFGCHYASLAVQSQRSKGEYGVTYQVGDALPMQNIPDIYEPGLVQEGESPEGFLRGMLEGKGLTSLMWSPIQGDEVPTGLIQLGKTEGSFTREDLEQLILFSGDVARTVEYIRLRISREKEKEALFREQESLIRSERASCIGGLMSSVAHQINNPLQAIQINLELAQREDLPLQKREHYLSIVQEEVGRLRKIVRDMIDHYRPHQRTKSLFPIYEVIEEAAALYEPELERLGIEVTFDLPEPSPQVWGIPEQLEQVFVHLLSNAIDAMPEGGKIHLSAQLQKGHIACMIRDSGKGIPEDQREDVFNPFFSTKENRHGLGLTICDNILTQHQGELVLLELDEEGTCFQITLPRGG
ncbi:MAG: HAMP domain-containing sensor histidine kinase [Anaerolineales bacterium]